MADKLIVDCSTGTASSVPLTSAEQAARDQQAQAAAVQSAAASTAAANRVTVQQRAQAALNANTTYLALATPTTAQAVAQVKVLTKECNALIRLMLGLLVDVADTA